MFTFYTLKLCWWFSKGNANCLYSSFDFTFKIPVYFAALINICYMTSKMDP